MKLSFYSGLVLAALGATESIALRLKTIPSDPFMLAAQTDIETEAEVSMLSNMLSEMQSLHCEKKKKCGCSKNSGYSSKQ